jgi:membrane-bound lytic murein transglycosylase F
VTNQVSNTKDTESLLFEISSNKHSATVADDNIFSASNRYMQGLVRGPTIAENDTIAWAIRNNANDLETELNRFLYKHFRFGKVGEEPKRSTFLNVLRQRYFESGQQIAEYYNPEMSSRESGIISPYDDLIKEVADSAGVDWLLVASIAAQETKFNPNSKSWAGAVGLMQVMPRFSEVSNEEKLYDVETNVREGVRIIKEHLDHYSYMDSTNKWSFALATYNAGPGHIADARRLAIDQNKNPNEWKNVEDALLKLMHRKYYKDARYGFTRGIETVRYVKEIKNRYNTYESILTMSEDNKKGTGFGVMGLFN